MSKSDSKDEEEFAPICNMKSRRTLKGHRGRILYFDWSMDRNHLITAGQVCDIYLVAEAMNMGHVKYNTLT